MVLTIRGQVKPTTSMQSFETASAAQPSIAFANAQTTGLYLANVDAGTMGIASAGQEVMTVGSGEVVVSGNVSATTLTGNIDAGDIVEGTVDVARLPDASTSAQGVVQLSDATDSTSTTLAATANSVKTAYDVADGKVSKSGDTVTGTLNIYENSSDSSFGVQTNGLNKNTYIYLSASARSSYLNLADDRGKWAILARGDSGRNGYLDFMTVNRSNSAVNRYVMSLWYNGTSSTAVYVNGGIQATSFTPSSDDRLKYNETFITDATSTIMKLRPQMYTKTSSIDTEPSEDDPLESGLISQEVWYDAPELRHLVKVPDDADPTDTIQTSTDPTVDPDYSSWGTDAAALNYTGLIPYLIKSTQEQQVLIDALKTELAEIRQMLSNS